MTACFPKTSFGRFFLINVISLALFWLLIQPMANYWRNQALFRMVASNESRLFLTHIRLLDKLPTIAERNGLFNPNDDVFSIRVSHLPPDMPRDGSNCSQSLRRRLERAFKQENIRYTDLLTRIVVSHAPITVMGSEEKYSDLETFLTHHYMQAEIALRRPDGIWIYAKHQIEIMPQNRLWLNTAALAIEFLLVMSGVALALNWLLRPLRKLVAATDRFGRTQEITPLRTDSGPVEVREAASAFNRMFSSIQRSFEERERFLTSFSHDLRTPLTRLRLRLEQVAQDDLREKLCADVDDLTDTLNRTITFLRSARSIEDVRRPIAVMPLLEALVEDRQGIGEQVTLNGNTAAVLLSWNRLRSALKMSWTTRCAMGIAPTLRSTTKETPKAGSGCTSTSGTTGRASPKKSLNSYWSRMCDWRHRVTGKQAGMGLGCPSCATSWKRAEAGCSS